METRILIPEQLRLLVADKNTGHSQFFPSSPTHSENNVKLDSSSSLRHNEITDSAISSEYDDTRVVLRSSRRRKSNIQTRARKFERSLSESSSNSEQHCELNSGNSESELEVKDDSDSDPGKPSVSTRLISNSRPNKEGSRNSIGSKLHLNHENCDSSVKICARERISKGTRLSPGDGRIKVLTLDGLTTITQDDVRCVFGCFDRLMEDPAKPGKQIRLCNWLKFVTRSAEANSNVNLIAKFVDRKPVLEFSHDLGAGEEVVAFFDLASVNLNIDVESINYRQNIKSEMAKANLLSSPDSINSREGDSGPLDLSNCKSPKSHKSSHSSSDSPKIPFATAIDGHPHKEYANSRSSTPASSSSASTISSEGPDARRKGSSPKKRILNSTRTSGIFSIRDVLQLQSSSSAFQPHLFNSSNSHQEQLILTPPLSSSATHATATALSSPSDPNRSVLSSPSSNPKLSPHDFHPAASRHKLTHTNLHNMLTHYGFNAGMGMGPGSSAAGAGASSLLRPILRTRGRERSLLPCEVCNKAFDRPSLLKRHMRTHTGEKPHVCDTCGKGFSTSSSLNTHRRIHSGEKPHQCPICGKRFTASSNLYYHRMTHNKEKPHKCLLCGKSFPTPGDLKSHQYVHSGSWPFSCRICNRGFSKQTNLRNHLLLHSGDKPHSCRICNKKFALACNLRAHLRTHEEDTLSTCLSCKRSFVNSLNMVVNGQCRVCASKLHGSVLPSQFLPIPRTEASGERVSPETFQSAGTLTSNITIPQPPSTTASVGISRKRSASPETRKESNRKSLLQPFGSTLPPLHGIQHPYHPLHHLQPAGPASSSLAAIVTGHQYPHPLLNNLNQQQLQFGPTCSERPNPFLEQLFEWNLRVAKETVGNLGLMQQKFLESQMLAAHLMTSPAGLSDLLRLQANANPPHLGRGAPALFSGGSNDFKNVTGGARLELLNEKK